MKSITNRIKSHTLAIIVLFLITVVASAIFIIKDENKYAVAICIMLDVFYASAISILAKTFLAQIRNNPYSYNTIYYVGAILFLTSLLITHIVLTIRLVHMPEDLLDQRFIQIPALLVGSALNYMVLSIPFITVLSVALLISNLSLIRHEGMRFVNCLGIILSVLLIGGEVAIYLGTLNVSGSAMYIMIHDVIRNIVVLFYMYFECMIIGVMVTHILVNRRKLALDKDYVIILGCGIQEDGQPQPLLRDRIERAISFRNQQLKESGKELTFVPSGGQGGDEIISESESMQRYLRSKGISPQQILPENQSVNTLENMRFSKAIIEKENPSAKIIFATTNYHVFRSGILARKENLDAEGIGAKSKWYFWPNALVREFIGLLVERRKSQALIITTITVGYTILTILCNLYL